MTIGSPQTTGSSSRFELMNKTWAFLSVAFISTWSPEVSFTAVFSFISSPPIYVYTNYKDMVLSEKIDRLSISSIEKENAPVVDVQKDYTWLYNLVIVLTTIALGIIFLLKLKRKNNT